MINFIENELTESVRALLNSVYKDKRRFYHDYVHINNMLKSLDTVIEEYPEIINNTMIDYKVMRIAILFHDVIQGTKFNESYSEEIARFILSSIDSYNTNLIDEICTLILVTDYGKITDTSNLGFREKLIRDLDLKELGADWNTYRHNLYLIRQEYPDIPYWEFKEGRVKFLKHLLSFPEVFSTTYFKHLEEKAMGNITKELEGYKEIPCDVGDFY